MSEPTTPDPGWASLQGAATPGPPAPGAKLPLETGVASTRSTRSAGLALILGALAIPFSIVAGIPAIVVGVTALRRARESDEALKARMLAWSGISLGVLSVLAFVWFVWL